ncbi:MAG: linear amide C-N hydrolase [Chitinophagaceae bacterium]|nr:linear amide C-N hydrolase [Chitinophagaceae bacterium]
MKKVILTFFTFVLTIQLAFPCSSIVLKEGNKIFLAKNFDWTYREGIIIKNLRGTNKTAYFTHSGEQANWTSIYGSVTFNQNGKEMPYGGMNEKGLVIEMLWLDLTKYNINEEKKYLNELEWIQYQLDNFETVQQVIDHLNDLKIYPIKGKIHYILTDNTGHSVVIEYLNGKPLAYKKEANTCQAITNNTVFHSEPYKTQIDGIRKNNTVSAYRYFQLEQEIINKSNKEKISEAFAFNILKKVTIPKGNFKTMWSIVYNINQKSISFFTDTHKEIKSINLSELDFGKELTYFNINQNELKNLSKELIRLTEAINYSYNSPSLVHLGIEENVARDISQHQFTPGNNRSSVFADDYFHFEISIPLEEERQTGFLAVMDNEQNFDKKQAVTGGYLYGNIGKGTLIVHIYGLKNGKYSMISFIDNNKNRKLDFDMNGKALEKYASFSDNNFTSENEIKYSNTSSEFNKSNAKISVIWKQ